MNGYKSKRNNIFPREDKESKYTCGDCGYFVRDNLHYEKMAAGKLSKYGHCKYYIGRTSIFNKVSEKTCAWFSLKE